MNGLRIYTNLLTSKLECEDSIFFSRRADGPFYRWSYEEKLGQWHYSRVKTAQMSPSELSLASWKGLPPALQARLIGHYLE